MSYIIPDRSIVNSDWLNSTPVPTGPHIRSISGNLVDGNVLVIKGLGVGAAFEYYTFMGLSYGLQINAVTV